MSKKKETIDSYN